MNDTILSYSSCSRRSVIQVPEFFVAHTNLTKTVFNLTVKVRTDVVFVHFISSNSFFAVVSQFFQNRRHEHILFLSNSDFYFYKSTTYHVAVSIYQFNFQDRSATNSFFTEIISLVQTCFSIITRDPFLLLSSSRTSCDIIFRTCYSKSI